MGSRGFGEGGYGQDNSTLRCNTLTNKREWNGLSRNNSENGYCRENSSIPGVFDVKTLSLKSLKALTPNPP